ncbi:MAG TPA: hypothetical protein VFH27_14460 [Longimicrobiaceae bacterium]|nr:hypothetical protein [Longimicrobiaceae bacterium]
MDTPGYDDSVFINCPFDSDFKTIFEALVFAVHDCGFVARCAMEVDDGSQVRIEKIFRIIEQCRYGIHDISRTQLDAGSGLPRFNMPLELGMFLGAKRFGRPKERQKQALILDGEPYRYQKFCSDIAGQDIRAHDHDPAKAITVVRNWLRSARKEAAIIPSGEHMADRYRLFRADLPLMCTSSHLNPHALIFVDLVTLVTAWLKENP